MVKGLVGLSYPAVLEGYTRYIYISLSSRTLDVYFRTQTLKKNFCIFRDPIDPITQQPILNLTTRKDVNVKIGMSKLETQFYETIDSMRLQPLAKTTRLRQGEPCRVIFYEFDVKLYVACAHPCLLKEFLNPQSNATTIAKQNTRKKGGSTIPLR